MHEVGSRHVGVAMDKGDQRPRLLMDDDTIGSCFELKITPRGRETENKSPGYPTSPAIRFHVPSPYEHELQRILMRGWRIRVRNRWERSKRLR